MEEDKTVACDVDTAKFFQQQEPLNLVTPKLFICISSVLLVSASVLMHEVEREFSGSSSWYYTSLILILLLAVVVGLSHTKVHKNKHTE